MLCALVCLLRLARLLFGFVSSSCTVLGVCCLLLASLPSLPPLLLAAAETRGGVRVGLPGCRRSVFFKWHRKAPQDAPRFAALRALSFTCHRGWELQPLQPAASCVYSPIGMAHASLLRAS